MTEKLSVKAFDENYARIREKIAEAAVKSGRDPSSVTLLAATKTVDAEMVNHAIDTGIVCVGENKVQELLSKDALLHPVHKHFIGHLQTNKVKDIITRVEMIHSVDSYRLAEEISKQALRAGTQMDILLEINIGNEESKSGFTCDEASEAVRRIAELERVHVRGLMAIPPICENAENNRKYFAKMNKLFIDIGAEKIDNSNMSVLSMGMSDDYEVAVSEGATLVRIGTALFGRRNYNLV